MLEHSGKATVSMVNGPASLVEFRLPDVGEGLTEAEIVSWFVQPGDAVTVNQVIVAIETAKAVVELPCPVAGVVEDVHVTAGTVVPVGTRIVSIRPQGMMAETGSAAITAPVEESGAVLVGYGTRSGHDGPSGDAERPQRRRLRHASPTGDSSAHPETPDPETPHPTRARAKPQVRRLARTLGVDLEGVVATGPHGDVTRTDVLAFAEGAQTPLSTEYASTPGDRLVPVRGVQRTMAEAMTRSAFSIPHAMVWRDVDVTRAEELVRGLRSMPSLSGTRVTLLTVASLGVISMVRSYPELQSLWTDDGILERSEVNLGIAVDSPRGLIVPNLKGAGPMAFLEVVRELKALIDRARAGACTPSDLTGGTITITNVGIFDVDGGSPIINPGESAIVALGRVARRPWVLDEGVVPRSVLTISMAFDHRVIDGATAARALSELAGFLTDPAARLLAD